jgi:hypothetical protein
MEKLFIFKVAVIIPLKQAVIEEIRQHPCHFS